MAYVDINGGNGHHIFRLTTSEKSFDNANKKSVIEYALTCRPNQSGWDWNWSGNPTTLSYKIGIGSKELTGTFPVYDGSSTTIVKEGTIEIDRTETDGNSVNCSFTFTDTTGANYTPGSCSGSYTLPLSVLTVIKKIYIKINNAWKKGIPYIKVNGSWKKAKKIFIKVNGSWKEST